MKLFDLRKPIENEWERVLKQETELLTKKKKETDRLNGFYTKKSTAQNRSRLCTETKKFLQ